MWVMDEEGLPIVDLAGSPRERGQTHGKVLRWQIARGLERWEAQVRKDTGRALADVVQEFHMATSFAAAIRRWTPELLEEVRGIAKGSGFDYDTILAYNFLDEWSWFARQRLRMKAAPTGCSAIGLRRGTGGHPVTAQTHDLDAREQELLAILRIHGTNGIRVISLTVGGVVAMSGCNDRGISINCNQLANGLPHSVAGLPVAFLLRGVLDQADFAAARRFIEEVPHASGQNYVLGGPQDVCDLECSAQAVVEVDAGSPVVLHTNHPLVQPDLLTPEASAESRARLAFLESRRPILGSMRDVRDALESPPICRHPGTVAAVASELSLPPRVFVTAGPPDSHPWRQVPFGEGA